METILNSEHGLIAHASARSFGPGRGSRVPPFPPKTSTGRRSTPSPPRWPPPWCANPRRPARTSNPCCESSSATSIPSKSLTCLPMLYRLCHLRVGRGVTGDVQPGAPVADQQHQGAGLIPCRCAARGCICPPTGGFSFLEGVRTVNDTFGCVSLLKLTGIEPDTVHRSVVSSFCA